MSQQPPPNPDALLKALSADDLDALTPEQISELEAALNSDETAAMRIADQLAQPDAPLAYAINTAEAPALPSNATWDRMWDNIAAETRSAPATAPPHRILRLWQPMAAAAACLFLATAWWMQSPNEAVDAWPVTLATNVEIEQLESFGDTMPLVMNVGEENMPVIWVLEDEGA